MKIQTFAVEGPLEIRPRKIEDDRGYFSEIFRLDMLAMQIGRVRWLKRTSR